MRIPGSSFDGVSGGPQTRDLQRRLRDLLRSVAEDVLSDLLLSKIQIVEINEKDQLDALLLFHDHDLGDDPDGIDVQRVLQVVRDDGVKLTVHREAGPCRRKGETLDRIGPHSLHGGCGPHARP